MTVSRSTFEAALGVVADRFENAKHGPYTYAQINVPDNGDAWANTLTLVERAGPAALAFLKQGQIDQPSVDFALEVPEGRAMTSLIIPSALVMALGRWGFDIEVSAYLTGPE